jgi:hypothetical protein
VPSASGQEIALRPQAHQRKQRPAVYSLSEAVSDGGLLSYGVDRVDPWRRAAIYADRILRGEKPGDLPVQLPTKFEMVVNLLIGLDENDPAAKPRLSALTQALGDLGWTAGRNVRMDVRWGRSESCPRRTCPKMSRERGQALYFQYPQ